MSFTQDVDKEPVKQNELVSDNFNHIATSSNNVLNNTSNTSSSTILNDQQQQQIDSSPNSLKYVFGFLKYLHESKLNFITFKQQRQAQG